MRKSTYMTHRLFGITLPTAPARPELLRRARSLAAVEAGARRIALLRSGRRHGPITRLITPWDVGELTHPFVFLGYYELAAGPQTLLGTQPDSGIATVTLMLSGALASTDENGHETTVSAGGARWMRAGEGALPDSGRASGEPLRAFQLWIGLSPSSQHPMAERQCVVAREVQREGPVRVILGQFGGARSSIAQAPSDINYFHVRLKDGERWRYAAPEGHNIAWLAVDRGGLRLQQGERVYWEQIALFGDSRGVIEVQADGETSFVLGSAKRCSQPLAQDGDYPDIGLEALAPSEDKASIGRRRRAQGNR
jgi:redox-sensitive bicupin YhaK (pirin superfamily)